MSYCVHCGVELADYEKACPLCGVPVIDPTREGQNIDIKPLYGDKVDEKKRINLRFVAMLTSLLLLVPFIVTTVVDVVFSYGMTWSAFVLGAEICAWFYIILPLYKKRINVYVVCLFATFVTALYVLMIETLTHNGGWFLPLALPIIVGAGLLEISEVFIFRKCKRGRLSLLGWAILPIAVYPCIIDIVIAHYLRDSFMPLWSWYVTLPLLVLGITVIVISRSLRITEWIRRKLFI